MRNKLTNINSNDGRFHNGNPAKGSLGTIVTADWLNGVQDGLQDFFDELNNVLKVAHITPNVSVKNQLAQAISACFTQKLTDSINFDSSVFGASAKAVKTAFDKAQSALNKANEVDESTIKKTGAQKITGRLRLNSPNAEWSCLQLGTQEGYWQVEASPLSHTDDRRLNFFYQGNNGTKTYFRFPASTKDEAIAYQSWVEAQIQQHITNKKSNAFNSNSTETIATSLAVKTPMTEVQKG